MNVENEVVPFDKNIPPIHLRRGLYEFTTVNGTNELAMVRSDGTVQTLNDYIDVTEFWKAYAEAIVYRLGRIERKLRGEGWKAHVDDRKGYNTHPDSTPIVVEWKDVSTLKSISIEPGILEMNAQGDVRHAVSHVQYVPEFDTFWGHWVVIFEYENQKKSMLIRSVQNDLWPKDV